MLSRIYLPFVLDLNIRMFLNSIYVCPYMYVMKIIAKKSMFLNSIYVCPYMYVMEIIAKITD